MVNLGTVKAIIRHNGVTLFEGLDLDERIRQQGYIQEIKAKLKANNAAKTCQQPFEFVVLETILQKTLQSLQDEFDDLAPTVEEHLAALQRYVHWERLKILLTCKLRVTLFQERVNSIRECIAELLESDDDMAGMYLSHKASRFTRPINAHEEVELLLESYLKTAEEISSRLQVLITDMQSTEAIVNIGLVGQRNELLLLELKLGIGTFAASMGGFGASVLGMNLPNHMEHSQYAFAAVLASLLTVAGMAFTLSWRRLVMLVRKH
jgi:magnesium transporter